MIDLDNYVMANDYTVPGPPKIGQHPMMAPELRQARNDQLYLPPDLLSDRFAWSVLFSYLLLSRHPVSDDIQEPASVDAIMASGQWPEDGRNLTIGDTPASALGPKLQALFRAGFSLDRAVRPPAEQWRLGLHEALASICIHSCGAAFVPDGINGVCYSCGGAWVVQATEPALTLTDPATGQVVRIALPDGAFIYLGRDTIPWASAYVSARQLLILRQGNLLYMAHKGSNPTLITFAGEAQRRRLLEYRTDIDSPELAGATLTLADTDVLVGIATSP